MSKFKFPLIWALGVYLLAVSVALGLPECDGTVPGENRCCGPWLIDHYQCSRHCEPQANCPKAGAEYQAHPCDCLTTFWRKDTWGCEDEGGSVRCEKPDWKRCETYWGCFYPADKDKSACQSAVGQECDSVPYSIGYPGVAIACEVGGA